MAERVLATGAAVQAARSMRRVLGTGLTGTVEQLLATGRALSSPGVWDGPQAVEFRGTRWPSTEGSLRRAVESIERLQAEAERITAEIMSAGSRGDVAASPASRISTALAPGLGILTPAVTSAETLAGIGFVAARTGAASALLAASRLGDSRQGPVMQWLRGPIGAAVLAKMPPGLAGAAARPAVVPRWPDYVTLDFGITFPLGDIPVGPGVGGVVSVSRDGHVFLGPEVGGGVAGIGGTLRAGYIDRLDRTPSTAELDNYLSGPSLGISGYTPPLVGFSAGEVWGNEGSLGWQNFSTEAGIGVGAGHNLGVMQSYAWQLPVQLPWRW